MLPRVTRLSLKWIEFRTSSELGYPDRFANIFYLCQKNSLDIDNDQFKLH